MDITTVTAELPANNPLSSSTTTTDQVSNSTTNVSATISAAGNGVPASDATSNLMTQATAASATSTQMEFDKQDSSQLHAPDATPPVPDPGLETVINITQRLLGLRGSPPGTLASLSDFEIKTLCQKVKPVLLSQPMLLELEAPIKICGDVHGQYTDLLRLFEYGGFPPEANYLFLGDYVDRGKQSIETICLLLAYKIQYPENFFILRGNHESAGINRIYGFYDECKRRYSIKLWKVFSDVFNCLPAVALVDEKILCMHGGLSPELTNLQQIADIQRPCDVPDRGLLCDILWSDPNADIAVRVF